MVYQFSPITLGKCLKAVDLNGFVLTETTHRPDYQLQRHSHERANLAFVLNGSFTEILDRRHVECGPQSVVVKPAGEAHANRYGRVGMRCLLIEVQPQQLASLHPWSKVFDKVGDVRGGILSVLAMRIYKEFRLMDGASPLAIEGLMLEITAELSRRSNLISESKVPHWLEEAKDIVHAHFAENLSLAGVARTVNVHPVHLARAFRKHFRRTLGEYVRHLRIEFARPQTFHVQYAAG